MAELESRFGTDIRLLGDLDYQEHRERGGDLFVKPRFDVTAAERSRMDLERLSGVPNLQQALLLRFLTAVGDLAHLGHATYGSRLHELIGEPNTETTRSRARLFALQALQDEPRVKEIRSLVVVSDPRVRDRVEIRASVVAIDSATAHNLVFPIDLEGGVT